MSDDINRSGMQGYYHIGRVGRPPKYKMAIADRIAKAESERPKPSHNRYAEPDEELSYPVDYHDAKAMLIYLADAVERPFIKKQKIRFVILVSVLSALLIALIFAICFSLDLPYIGRYIIGIIAIVLISAIIGYLGSVINNAISYFGYWKSVRSGKLFKKTDPGFLVMNAAYHADVHNRYLSDRRII